MKTSWRVEVEFETGVRNDYVHSEAKIRRWVAAAIERASDGFVAPSSVRVRYVHSAATTQKRKAPKK